MSYFAIYDCETGEIKNVVECPDFLQDTIHLEEDQSYIKINMQVSPRKYLVINSTLIEKS